MADNSRIEELRRRVQQDPASIAFAQLAEEHRRAGDFQEAVRVSRAGLEHHPAYLSAHVTLGRALMELGQFDEARVELDHVLRAAPDNLMTLRIMAELHSRRSDEPREAPREAALPPPRSAPPDPALEELEGWLAAILAARQARSA